MSLPKFFVFALICLAGFANAQIPDIESSYRFLVTDRKAGGILYRATAGELHGRMLPLSFYDTPEYWGEYVCKQPGVDCAVVDIYNPADYSLAPMRGVAGELQTERVNAHNGTNIYDAATWQIAVVLGQVVNRFGKLSPKDAYGLATNQNELLKSGFSGNAPEARQYANRAVTQDGRFLYNDRAIRDGAQAYSFRMLSRSWLAADPFIGTSYASIITTKGLPKQNTDYQSGKITWSDWKPITGENAWAFLLGPLHAAHLYYVKGQGKGFVPFHDLAVQNALAVLPTFATMQSQIGAVYSVPSGTLSNQGDQLIDPHQVSVENNASLYAGLRVLAWTLRVELSAEKDLGKPDRERIESALKTVGIMIDGGRVGNNKPTAGLLSFFKTHAWRNNEFVQGGLANDPKQSADWIPTLTPRAIDANTWGIAAIGAKQIDDWFGFGAAYENWRQVKRWGAFGVDVKLWGVGFSDRDGNGIDQQGRYRQGILSSEWTAGAINLVRSLIAHYKSVPQNSKDYRSAQSYLQRISADERAMLEAMGVLRADNYERTTRLEKPNNYQSLAFPPSKSYLYASKRHLIPFGWYANPIPSTCATAWVIMLADRFDPFGYGGQPN